MADMLEGIKGVVYVVTAHGGEYDDSWDSNLYVMLSKSAAEAEVLRLTGIHKHCVSVLKEVAAVGREARKTLLPEEVQEEVPAPPRCPKKTTKENMAEYRAALNAYNELVRPIHDRNTERAEALRIRSTLAAQTRARELGCTNEHINHMNSSYFWPGLDTGITYDYDELEVRV